MKPAPKHPRENDRLTSLKELKILDTLPEDAFDEITMLASQICQSPIALVSLVDESRQWFKSKYGLAANETPRDFAFCAHAILGEEIFTVPDATKDERFKDNPLVTGDPKIMFYAGAPLLSPDGHPIGTICVIDHKPKKLSDAQNQSLQALSKQVGRLLQLRTQLAEQQRLNLELKFKKVAVENLSEGVVLQGTDYRIVEFNQAALETLGLTADQLTGKTSLDPDWQAIKEDGTPFPGMEHPAVLALQTGEKQRSMVMGISTPKADMRWILINSTPVFLNQSKKPSYSVTSFSNITAQKNAKSLIEKKEAELIRVLNGVPAMIGHWKSDLTNIHANTAYTSYFGKTPEQIKGQSIQDLLGPELFRINTPYIEKVLQGQAQTFQRDMTTADGNVRNVLATYLPEFEKQNVIGFFVIITDLTEIKRLENERELLAAKMIESAKLSTLGEMAGGIAHEVNTPLAVITTKTSQLLESFEEGSPSREEAILQLQKIKITTERIAKIIKGLRQFSRNSEKDPKEKVLISSVVESTLDLCHEKITHAGIRLTTNIQESISVQARATELSQVLLNLISNSIDAIENLSEKWIKIAVTQSNDKAMIAISDSGNGIPEEIFDKIMNPFFTTKEVGKGTGLGLSISNGIIASHGGKLFLDRESKNTCFVIELPLPRSLK